MRPYEGNDKYIFVSYAHKNSDRVLPIMQAMIHHGFRLWYDSGIEAGTEWPEYIADRLANCDTVVVFMTDDVVASKNCRNEINYALNLEKDVLVVYLDPVILSKGLSLQLNSTQSMYKYLQPSDEIFLQELFRAKILRDCRGDTGSTQEETVPKPKTNTLITNICTLGSNDFQNPFPAGTYATTINRDQFQVIYFHSSLNRAIGYNGTTKVTTQIFNSDNMLVYDYAQDIACQATYSRFSTSWVIRGTDGTFVPAGAYRVEVSVNYSPVFSYRFFVSAPSEGILAPSANRTDRTGDLHSAIDGSLEKQRKKCFDQLSRKKGALLSLALLVLFLAFVITLTQEVPYGALICATGFIICWVALLKYTTEHIHRNVLLALILITLALPFYGLFLMISGIINACRDKRIKEEIARLSSFRG